MSAKEQLDTAFKWVWKGLNASHKGDSQKAIDSFRKASELDPDKAFPLYYLGLEYYKIEDYQNAITNFEKALKIQPDYPIAWLQMGLAYLAVKNDTKAKECIKKGNELASLKREKEIK